MPFRNYKNIAAVAKEYQIKWISANFVNEVEFPVPQNFREELEFLFSHGTIYGSEYAICENLIYPILKEVWKSYYQKLTLWSHETLTYDEKLSGQPDYIVAKLSPLGRMIFDKPYFLLVEAKLDNFNEGWGHFSYQLSVISYQYLSLFAQHDHRLFSVVNYVFQECFLQLENEKNSL